MRSCKTNAGCTPLPPAASRRGPRLPTTEAAGALGPRSYRTQKVCDKMPLPWSARPTRRPPVGLCYLALATRALPLEHAVARRTVAPHVRFGHGCQLALNASCAPSRRRGPPCLPATRRNWHQTYPNLEHSGDDLALVWAASQRAYAILRRISCCLPPSSSS